MKTSALLRYGLWLAVAETAAENHLEYHMTTTWLPHLVTNTLALLLPDALRLAFGRRKRGDNLVEDVLLTMARDNDDYAYYVAPLALGYILSHPRFNIYKGALADIRAAGLGLDAIPHAATAFGLTALVSDTLRATDQMRLPNDPLGGLVRVARRSPALTSFTVLALLSFFWELSEYRVHQHELKLRGDVTKINMQWSAKDTANDVAANGVGWLLALLWRRADPTVSIRRRGIVG